MMLFRIKSYHLLFAAALAALIVLGVRWFVLNFEQVNRVHAYKIEILSQNARLKALELGRLDGGGPRPTLPDDSPLEIVTRGDLSPAEIVIPLEPNRPELAIRPKPARLLRIKEKHTRRLVMVYGEGSLLLGLILVCVLMLYRLLLSERKSRSEMETFFQAVSHELRTPLSGLRALLDTLSSRQVGPEELARYARLGLRETTRLQGLIENVLLANRIDRRIFEARPRAIDIVPETREFIERRNRIFSRQPCDLIVECGEELKLYADPDLMPHVMGNLMDNAFKYSPEDPDVKVRLREDARWGMIDVEDNGIGLDVRERGLIFEKFVRGDNARLGEGKGSGLGLFIVRELVQSFGGELEVESEGHGRGSRFTIKLKRV